MSDTPPKVEPEKLVLRGKPRRVTRFRRNVVIGAAAAVTIVVSGAAWLALRAPSLKFRTSNENLYNTDSKPSADQLAALPASYDKMKSPKLGPPLPGDLGAPIVGREKQLGMTPALGSLGPRGEEDADRAEHLRQAQLAQQAREAKVMFQTSKVGRVQAIPVSQQSGASTPPRSPTYNPAGSDDQNQQLHKAEFTKEADGEGHTILTD